MRMDRRALTGAQVGVEHPDLIVLQDDVVMAGRRRHGIQRVAIVCVGHRHTSPSSNSLAQRPSNVRFPPSVSGSACSAWVSNDRNWVENGRSRSGY